MISNELPLPDNSFSLQGDLNIENLSQPEDQTAASASTVDKVTSVYAGYKAFLEKSSRVKELSKSAFSISADTSEDDESSVSGSNSPSALTHQSSDNNIGSMSKSTLSRQTSELSEQSSTQSSISSRTIYNFKVISPRPRSNATTTTTVFYPLQDWGDRPGDKIKYVDPNQAQINKNVWSKFREDARLPSRNEDIDKVDRFNQKKEELFKKLNNPEIVFFQSKPKPINLFKVLESDFKDIEKEFGWDRIKDAHHKVILIQLANFINTKLTPDIQKKAEQVWSDRREAFDEFKSFFELVLVVKERISSQRDSEGRLALMVNNEYNVVYQKARKAGELVPGDAYAQLLDLIRFEALKDCSEDVLKALKIVRFNK
jgi:hypothetical protein